MSVNLVDTPLDYSHRAWALAQLPANIENVDLCLAIRANLVDVLNHVYQITETHYC